jgi:lipooligosaccharide transport system permease protein
MRHVVWGEVLWAALLGTVYATVVGTVLLIFHALGFLTLDVWRLPLVVPLAFLAGCAFAAVALCFTALIPTIDHMNLPIFLLVLPLGFASATYFPIQHPVVVALATFNPLYHLAEGLRGLLLGGPVLYHLTLLTASCALLIAVLVPLDTRLLSRRVLGR